LNREGGYNMKKLISFFLVIILALGSIGLVACGNGEEEEEEVAPPPVEEEEEVPPTEEEEEPPSGGDLSWGDMPVYSDADQVQKGSWGIPPAQGEWSKVEWRYYETGDSADKVASFYRDEMPDEGWDEMMWMEAEGVAWAFFTKNGEKDGAMFWVASDEGETVFALMRATQ